jgi:crotonobetaine/carnitine-CoA ligase
MRYSGWDDPTRWVIPRVLDEQAARTPHLTWLTEIDGETLTFGAAAVEMRRVAGYLAGLGVKPGDHVAIMLPNGCDYVRAWLGTTMLGAVAVLLNTELSGNFLRHQVANCGAELAIVEAGLLPTIEALGEDVGLLKRIAVVGGEGHALDWASWQAAPALDAPFPAAHAIACIMYTSGTSGPAKGVLMPHAHCALFGMGTVEAAALSDDDVYYITLPLFHANGLLMQLSATLLAGIPAVIRRRFSATGWLDDVRACGATVTNLLGATTAFVIAQPETALDGDHRLRTVMLAPNAPAHEAALRARFGVTDVLSGLGMTEINIPIWGRLGHSRPGACGWPREDRFAVRVADPETDREVPRGTVGELQVRPLIPFAFMAGYHAMPDKTVEAWRNLWFHTGDAVTMADDGLITFVDRLKECIRRRSENISATEVENAVIAIEGVAEVAAFGVPAGFDGGEDEVMIAVVLAECATLDCAAIGDAADVGLPRFARPRFVEILDELPKTATGKVQKAILRQRGCASAYDRQTGVCAR